MSIEFGAVSLEPSTVSKQLRGDMKDDWFFDPLNYGDMLQESTIKAIIQANLEKNSGLYESCERHVFNVPKSNFTLRYALETSVSDRFLYHGLVAHLVPFFDRLLGPSVYSHRYNYDKPDERYLFRRGISAWADFVGSVRSTLEPGMFLVSTDLTNYYECVDLLKLRDGMVSLLPKINVDAGVKSQIRRVLDDLFRCLGSWTFEKERGLPQNRDASSFLANIYMHPVDEAMHTLGYKGRYFRYMDDIKIVCPTEFAARQALKHLVLELRKRGLAVNAKKTSIVPEEDKHKIGECLQQGSEIVIYLDSVWRTNNPGHILSKVQELRAYAIELLEGGEFDSRNFRFCIKRLYNLLMSPSFSVPPEFFEPITPLIIDGLSRLPAATDQISKYLRAAPMSESHLKSVASYLLDGSKSIYTWQNYQLWFLLTAKQHASPDLLDAAMKLVQGDDNASRAGATLYAGALGGPAYREKIARRFKDLSSFFGQRIALIAIHELSFRPLIEDFVKPYLRPDLIGVYKNLKTYKEGYMSPLEPVLLGEDSFEDLES